jgi:hypothetical protein
MTNALSFIVVNLIICQLNGPVHLVGLVQNKSKRPLKSKKDFFCFVLSVFTLRGELSLKICLPQSLRRVKNVLGPM